MFATAFRAVSCEEAHDSLHPIRRRLGAYLFTPDRTDSRKEAASLAEGKDAVADNQVILATTHSAKPTHREMWTLGSPVSTCCDGMATVVALDDGQPSGRVFSERRTFLTYPQRQNAYLMSQAPSRVVSSRILRATLRGQSAVTAG